MVSEEEESMSQYRPFIVLAAGLMAAALFASTQTASAQQAKPPKVTYEAAWKRCQVEVNKLPQNQVAQRHARGAACMKKLGHNL
jgi:hypothetical protein